MSTHNLHRIALEDATYAGHLSELRRLSDNYVPGHRGSDHPTGKVSGIRRVAARFFPHLG